jgi:hypothetical protein
MASGVARSHQHFLDSAVKEDVMKKKNLGGFWLLLLALWGCGSLPTGDQPPPNPQDNSTTISPASAVVGSSDLTLTIIGSNFAGRRHFFSQAVWSANGSNTPLATTFVRSTQLTAILPSDLLAIPVTAQIFVQTGDPMGDVPLTRSRATGFSVTTSAVGTAKITSISPSSAAAGSSDIVLSITGSNFDAERIHASIAGWSAVAGAPHCCITWLHTTYVSSTELTAVISSALLQRPGTAEVFVETGDPQGMSDGVSYPRSNSVTFTIDP